MDKSKYDMRNEESDKNFMVCRVTAPFGVPGQGKKKDFNNLLENFRELITGFYISGEIRLGKP